MTMITPVAKKSKKAQTTRIFFILDRSGSMATIRDETIGGYNSFVADQKKLPGKAYFTLVQFDNKYEVHLDGVSIKDVPEMNRESFVPRGMTAMLDAVGLTIEDQLKKVKDNEKVIFAILTDGEENASKSYSYARVKSLITDVEGNHKWEVLFIGANIDAASVGRSMGIAPTKLSAFDFTSKGAKDAFGTISAGTTILRGASMNYSSLSGASAKMEASNFDMNTLYSAVRDERTDKIDVDPIDKLKAEALKAKVDVTSAIDALTDL